MLLLSLPFVQEQFRAERALALLLQSRQMATVISSNIFTQFPLQALLPSQDVDGGELA